MPTCTDSGRPIWMSRPAVVQTEANGHWRLLPEDTREVHVAVLFRDPPVRGGRQVERVLDLRDRDGAFAACPTCWVRAVLDELGPLPAGLRLALDNGVRCAWDADEVTGGWDADCSLDEYTEKARCCLGRTRSWLDGLRHPGGGGPGVLVCDEVLASALARMGVLTRRDGSAWSPQPRFVDSVGDELRVLDRDGLLLAHPVSVRRERDDYGPALHAALPRALALARVTSVFG